MTDNELLLEFLKYPISCATPVFDHFNSLPDLHMYGQSNERTLYIPGKRKDRVLLVAHADTYWQESFDQRKNEGADLQIRDGLISNRVGGLGADDRAGCAIVWLLRNLGHSILITNGEERGSIGIRWLLENEPKFINEINTTHGFAVQFDRQNASDFKCYDVGTDAFRRYVEENTGYSEADRKRSTDIKFLCKQICGVNLSIGYYNEHTENEYLVIDEWAKTLLIARNWLGKKELPKFELKFAEER